MDFSKLIGTRPVFIDGAMGTQIQKYAPEYNGRSEMLNDGHTDIIYDIHTAYINAGADIIITNTFGISALKYSDEVIEKLVGNAVSTAKKAAADSGRDIAVALDIGPTGKLLKPFGELDFDTAYTSFAKVIRAGSDCDMIAIETMTDIVEARCALLAAKENSDKPVMVTLSFDENGRLLTGTDIPTAVTILQSLGADAVGINCGLGPKQMESLTKTLYEYADIPVAVSPNAGMPEVVDGKTVYNTTPEEFALYGEKIVLGGASLIGGCCGTSPEYIKALYEKCSGMNTLPVIKKNRTAVTSLRSTVEFGKKPLVIGERLNPTGKPKLKQALKDGDTDYICSEALSQEENGSDILDVNTGIPAIDEAEVLSCVINELQYTVSVPLQIDTSDVYALEKALRTYHGRALINSVNGKEESMSAVLPLAAKYGSCIVALTLDENGIPPTAEERAAIAGKIIARAAEYGIPKERILADALTMTVSTDMNNAKITLDAVKLIKEKYGINTVLGVSNISFGLPNRDVLNSSFLTLALESGLDGAIINPSSKPCMNAVYSYCALTGKDPDFSVYINNSASLSESGTKKAESRKTENEGSPLFEAITKGLADSASRETENLIKTVPSMDIINGEIIPALDRVGTDFEKNRIFLPQLLMSAEAATSAFAVIRKSMGKNTSPSKAKVILATVKGDIHDIGKNIVKVLLENYGYDVIDMGKDVAPEDITDLAVKENVRFVGLSALMTTTVPMMEKTVKLLAERKPDCMTVVGGAVLTKEFADSIGASYYAKDAMATVRYLESLQNQTKQTCNL